MRRLGLLLPLLFPLLWGCTGSQEPPLPALVAAGGEGEVRFYRARDLQGGTALPVTAWSTPDLQDLAYSNALGTLFLLFPDRVEAYPTQGFTENAAPQGTPTLASLPADCAGGYLRLGQRALLAHCPGAGRAFLLALPGLGTPQEADLTGLPLEARLALLPQGVLDLLGYLTREALGYRPPLDPGGTPRWERPLDPLPAQDPFDLRTDGSRLLGLAATFQEVRLYTLQGNDLQSRRVLGDFPGEARLALDPVGGVVVYGRGFQTLEPRDSGHRETFRTYTAGLVGQDAYLYLARGPALEVFDLFPSPPLLLRAVGLGFSPRSLAFIPVE
ncbi:hypothetical protein [Thermus thermamylovorans]|uniref:hypothetical protein n=1 Tax=Thermus thermamylovorans TaxID=2509362 RepID=UPI00191BD591|nr:hypothetical protein [Thermus thermamylovorans]